MKIKDKLYENRKEIIFLSIFSVLMCSVLFLPYTVRCHDTYFHIERIKSILTGIENGDWFPKIYPYYYDGFGYSTSLFYSDFFLYIPVVLCLIGIDVLLSYKIYNALLVFATVFSSYFCACRLMKNKQAAIITSLIYSASSYFAVDIFIRGALGETQAFVFLPFCLLGMYNSVYGDKNDRTALIIGFSGLVLSHNLSLLLTSILFAIFLIINITKLIKEPSRILNLFKSSITVIFITGFFLFPMVEQLLSEQFFSSFHAKIWNPGKAAIRVRNLFIGANLTENPVFTPSLGLTMLIVLIVCLTELLKKRKDDLNKFSLNMLLGALGCIFASTSIFPWYQLDPYLNIIQFPSRLFIFVTLFLSFSFGVWWTENIKIDNLKLQNCIIVLIALISISQFSYTTYKGLKIAADEGRIITDTENFVLWDENYLHANNNRKLWAERDKYINTATGVKGPVKSTLTRDYYNRYIMYQDNYTDNSLEISAVYYLGYKAIDEDSGEELKVQPSENGWLEVEIGNKEKGKIRVFYGGTTIQHIAPYISIIFVILLIIYKYKNREKNNY